MSYICRCARSWSSSIRSGNEDFSDPKNPTFGRGGCGTLMPEYKRLITKPWRQLKRERLGGACKPFHATEFEHSGPTMRQIAGINGFLARPFWRFASMCDIRTVLPPGMDGHQAIALATQTHFTRLVAEIRYRRAGADLRVLGAVR